MKPLDVAFSLPLVCINVRLVLLWSNRGHIDNLFVPRARDTGNDLFESILGNGFMCALYLDLDAAHLAQLVCAQHRDDSRVKETKDVFVAVCEAGLNYAFFERC